MTTWLSWGIRFARSFVGWLAAALAVVSGRGWMLLVRALWWGVAAFSAVGLLCMSV